MNAVIYKAIQGVILLVFAICISDHRKKPNMMPLVNPTATIILKSCYAVPILAYGWSLIALKDLFVLDYVALALTLIGTVIVFKAKRDLSDCHCWAGYYLEGKRRIRRGIYGAIRHPMYIGILFMIAGGLLVFSRRLAAWQTATAILFISYILSYLFLVARREDRVLERVEFDQDAAV